MITLNPQFIKDANGKDAMVVLTTEEFDKIIQDLEELEDIIRYDEAKKEDDGERILLSDYLKARKKINV